jgi:hypothetical protein
MLMRNHRCKSAVKAERFSQASFTSVQTADEVILQAAFTKKGAV